MVASSKFKKMWQVTFIRVTIGKIPQKFDNHAPLRKSRLFIRENAPWQTEEIKQARTEGREEMASVQANSPSWILPASAPSC